LFNHFDQAILSRNRRGPPPGHRRGARPDIIAPPPERYQHGPVERLEKAIGDHTGAVGRPYRSVDTLAIMERRGTITAAMRAAGETYREKFKTAQLDPLHAADLGRTRGNYGGAALALKIEAAREHIWRATLAVGGLASPGGSCLWHVLGWERSLKEWAIEQGWNHRQIAQETASGILVAALGMLEAHYQGKCSNPT
jgi:hypothetical protein